MKTFNNYINGKEVAAQDGLTIPVIDPVTGKQYANAVFSGPDYVDSAMKEAFDSFLLIEHLHKINVVLTSVRGQQPSSS